MSSLKDVLNSRFVAILTILFALTHWAGCSKDKQMPSVSAEATSEPAEAPSTPSAESPSVQPPVAPSSSQDGEWSTLSAVMAGTPFPKTITDTITLTLRGDEYEASVGGKLDKGTCKTDRSQTPNRMEIVSTAGANAGKTFFAIVEFPTEDEMRISYDLTGMAYPTEFESTAENGLYVVVYGRKK